VLLSIKVFVASILCSSWIGNIIAWWYGNRIPFYGTYIDTAHEQIKSSIKAMLFWKFYESAEVRFVQQYLKDEYDTIELGSSIGAVSVQIGKKIKNKKLIVLEANSKLMAPLQKNLSLNGLHDAVVVNAAYGSQTGKLWLEFGDENIVGKISSPQPNKAGEWVDALSLSTIIASHHLHDFALVCDIEGAEADLIVHEAEALQHCKLLIIETHETSMGGQVYNPDQLKQRLLDIGFRLIDQHGVNLVLARDEHKV
jgi:FkbM family methyltransferase